MLIDLSHPLRAGMPVWPGDPAVRIHTAATVATDGYNLLELHLGSQTGTHVDAPSHVDDALPTLGALPLDRFTGAGVVADLRGHRAGQAITTAELAPVLPGLRPGVVLLLCTGWSRHWGSQRYADHPWLHPDAAARVVAAGVRTVGVDAPSVDRSDRPAGDLPTHQVLARAGAVIAENLTGLERLLELPAPRPEIRVWLLPLAIESADGSPVRAVAEIGNDP